MQKLRKRFDTVHAVKAWSQGPEVAVKDSSMPAYFRLFKSSADKQAVKMWEKLQKKDYIKEKIYF